MKDFHQENASKRKRIIFSYIFAACFVIAAFLAGIGFGSVSIPISSILPIITDKLFGTHNINEQEMQFSNLIFSIRLPRVVLSFLVGASLAIAGAALQGLLKNPLADPYTLGISSGASLGAVLVIFFNIHIPIIGQYTLPFVSFAAASVTLLIMLTLSTVILKKLTIESIILIGIMLSSFLGAVMSLLIALSGDELRQIVTWLLGSVSMRGWSYVQLLLPFFIIGSLLLFFSARELNAMSFGDDMAQSLGVNLIVYKVVILVCASLLTGGAVAVSGTIGFVGLVVPHAVRMVIGSDHRHLLPLALLNGGAFLIAADLIARTIIDPREIPIGVITALVGAPVFAILFFKKYR